MRAKDRKTGPAPSKGDRSGGAEANEGRQKKARVARSAEKKEKQVPLPQSIFTRTSTPITSTWRRAQRGLRYGATRVGADLGREKTCGRST